MLKKWFLNKLNTIGAYNNYNGALTVAECNKIGKYGSWTPTDLVLREWLNNGGGSSKGFLGISRAECIKCYDYILENLKELISLDMVNKEGYNNFGFKLWNDYGRDLKLS